MAIFEPFPVWEWRIGAPRFLCADFICKDHTMSKACAFFFAVIVFLTSAIFIQASYQEPPTLFIDGYAGKTSYKPGEQLTLHISTSAPKYTLEIARLGAKREVVLAKKD